MHNGMLQRCRFQSGPLWSWHSGKVESGIRFTPSRYDLRPGDHHRRDTREMKKGIHPDYVATTVVCGCGKHVRGHGAPPRAAGSPSKSARRPPVLHGQAEDPRHRRLRRALREALRQAEQKRSPAGSATAPAREVPGRCPCFVQNLCANRFPFVSIDPSEATVSSTSLSAIDDVVANIRGPSSNRRSGTAQRSAAARRVGKRSAELVPGDGHLASWTVARDDLEAARTGRRRCLVRRMRRSPRWRRRSPNSTRRSPICSPRVTRHDGDDVVREIKSAWEGGVALFRLPPTWPGCTLRLRTPCVLKAQILGVTESDLGC